MNKPIKKYPKEVAEGKLPSGGEIKSIELESTAKVVDLLIKNRPKLKVVSFKYEENKSKSFNKLEQIAHSRLKKGHDIVVGNDLHLNNDEQRCFIFEKTGLYSKAEGKIDIARALAERLGGMSVRPSDY